MAHMPNGSSQAPAGLDEVLVRSEDIVARTIAGECLLVPIARRGASLDAIYNLNRVGAHIWESIDGLTTGHAIVAGIAERFDVAPETAAADFTEFASLLLSVGALRVAAARPG
jgi:hypothetical protein